MLQRTLVSLFREQKSTWSRAKSFRNLRGTAQGQRPAPYQPKPTAWELEDHIEQRANGPFHLRAISFDMPNR